MMTAYFVSVLNAQNLPILWLTYDFVGVVSLIGFRNALKCINMTADIILYC